MVRKENSVVVLIRRKLVDIKSGAGSTRTTSISKTKNRIVSKKNRREKGTRADFLGSNPHSKGEALSRS